MKDFNKQRDPLENAMDTLKNTLLPTAQQKENMLNQVLLDNQLYHHSAFSRIGQSIMVYPWRFAFGISTAQAVFGTLIFGTQYTNLFLSFFGG